MTEPRTPRPVLETSVQFGNSMDDVETCTVQFTFPVIEPMERADLDALWCQVREFLARKLRIPPEPEGDKLPSPLAGAIVDDPPRVEEAQKALALGADIVRVLRQGKPAIPYRIRDTVTLPPDWEAVEFVESGNRERPVILRVGRDGVRVWNPGARSRA